MMMRWRLICFRRFELLSIPINTISVYEPYVKGAKPKFAKKSFCSLIILPGLR